jgi:GNAT superfamily N-acetyltransferase
MKAEYIPYKESHLDSFTEVNIEYMSELSKDILRIYNFDMQPAFDPDLPQWVKNNIHNYTDLKPPEGNLYIIETDQGIAGMGAIHKLSEQVGEIKRMYKRPKFRGNGFGRRMINVLMEEGKNLGCLSYKLDTPKWAKAAQHIYKTSGFVEREIYPESEIPPIIQPYWMWMEKK